MTPDLIRNLLPVVLSAYHEQYSLRDVPIAVDYLRPIFEERGWVDRIYWEKFLFESAHIFAQVQFYRARSGVYGAEEDCALIQFSSSLNFCWSRFAICKEMYHALIDKDGSTRITTTQDLLKLSEVLVSESSARLAAFSPYLSEGAAEILALETLFPFELRLHYESRYREGEITDHQLATRFRIPEEYARMGMYPGYFEAVREIRKDSLVQI